MYNLFYVESPLQLLSAISALNKFNSNKAILIVNLSSGDRLAHDTQIRALIGPEWAKVYIRRQSKYKPLSLLWQLQLFFYFRVKYNEKINLFFFFFRGVSQY
jgi:hypothetical protein